MLFRDKCVEKRKTFHSLPTTFTPNRSLDCYSADCYREYNVFVKPNEQNRACSSYAMARKRRMKANLLSSFIFLWASCCVASRARVFPRIIVFLLSHLSHHCPTAPKSTPQGGETRVKNSLFAVTRRIICGHTGNHLLSHGESFAVTERINCCHTENHLLSHRE